MTLSPHWAYLSARLVQFFNKRYLIRETFVQKRS